MPESTVDPRLAAMVASVLMESPVARTLGIRLDALAVDRVELVLPFSPNNVTVRKVVHGGVIATLIDVAGAAAAFTNVDLEVVHGGATGALSIQYLAPADGVALRAVAEVIRRGKRQVSLEVSVYADGADEGPLVAKALMTTALF
ncbi:PaaI family thioesterase [Cupriavidus sp. 2KB_3]|uniref:PaaI family thioesterase n=1 Tax=Cupriavidus TaxID=106589 RepID=UPI0011F026FE|nr:PaaI family thioesterase [Cupriavidus campinensis]